MSKIRPIVAMVLTMAFALATFADVKKPEHEGSATDAKDCDDILIMESNEEDLFQGSILNDTGDRSFSIFILESAFLLSEEMGLEKEIIEDEIIAAGGRTGEPIEVTGILIDLTGVRRMDADVLPILAQPGKWIVIVYPSELPMTVTRCDSDSAVLDDVHEPAIEAAVRGDDQGPRPGPFAPWAYCGITCETFGVVKCGNEPTCSATPLAPGIQACIAAAKCRRDLCLWAQCVLHETCVCEWYARACERYRRRHGKYPGRGWSPPGGTPWLACSPTGVAAAATCFAVYAAEAALCLPKCLWPRL